MTWPISAIAVALLAPTAWAQRPGSTTVIAAHGKWAALRFGAGCEARSRALLVRRGKPPAFAGFAFTSGRGPHGAFYARLGRPSRGGSSVILAVGEQPFLLPNNGAWAWSADPRQQAAIIAAVRVARTIRVEARDASGRRAIDRYATDGAATAIDSAAAACARAGKSR